VELPITVVFEPPSQAELRALLRRRRMWVAAAILALAIGVVLVAAGVSQAEAQATASSVALAITSRPPGAAIAIDGRHRGHTPALLTVPAGEHRIALRSQSALDADYTLDATPDGAALDAVLWRRNASVRRLRPSVPGAALEAVSSLADGRLALVMRTTSDSELRVWRLGPFDGTVEPLYAGVPGSRVSLAADGERLAYIGREVGPSASRTAWLDAGRSAAQAAGVVWRTSAVHARHVAPRAVWRAPTGEAPVDLSWSPTRDELVVATSADMPGGSIRTRLWLVDASGESDARLLYTLPSAVVPGAHAWSPDGKRLVLAAHAGSLNALCLLDLDGDFRYLADLEVSDRSPLPYLPVAWSPDSRRLVFVAPHQHPSPAARGWFASSTRRAVYVAEIDAPDPRLIAEIDAETPAWREDGRILLVSRQHDDGRLGVQLLDESGQSHTLLQVPLRVGPRYAVAWDTRVGQLLVNDASSGSTEFWFVGLSAEQRA